MIDVNVTYGRGHYGKRKRLRCFELEEKERGRAAYATARPARARPHDAFLPISTNAHVIPQMRIRQVEIPVISLLI